MPGALQEDDAADSRTAAIGSQPRGKRRRGSQPPSSSRSRKRKRGLTKKDLPDFVPSGSRFSESVLTIDTSPSASSSSENSSDMDNADKKPSGAAQPTVNWNPVNKNAIRTKLRPSGATAQPVSQAQSQLNNSFEAVNGRFWRGSSASADSADHAVDGEGGQRQSEGETAHNPQVISDSSDGWDPAEAEGDESIVLNMGAVDTTKAFNAASAGQSGQDIDVDMPSGANGMRPEASFSQVLTPEELSRHREKKEAAARQFNSRYTAHPQILADLHRGDLETQAKYIFYTTNLEELDLLLPIKCTDCLKEGHLAEICPEKECQHCGAWESHESRFCPVWRRCQRCRERGHDESSCESLLRELPSLVPCDLCASNEHTEEECDMIWKVPMSQTRSGPIFISVSCCFCTSSQHLLGDCPRRPFEMKSSSWSLKTFDPSLFAPHPPLADLQLPESTSHSQFRIKGRAAERAPSPDSDDALGRFGRSAPIKKDPPRGNIRIGGIGRGPKPDHGPDDDYYDRNYRDRQYFGNNTRQRSLSPPRQYNLRRSGGDGNGGNGFRRSGPPPNRGGRGRGRGGGGGGSGRGGSSKRQANNGDTYRPMPSAGKKAWAKHRS